MIKEAKEIAKDFYDVRKWTLEQWGWGACLGMVVAVAIKVIIFGR